MPQDLQPDNETQVPLLADAAAPGTAYGAVDDAGHGVNPHQSEAGASGTFSKNLGTLNAFAIIISIVIGSGIFTSTGSVDANVPSPGVALIAWLVGGVLALAGATTLAELGTAIPGEGLVGICLSEPFPGCWHSADTLSRRRAALSPLYLWRCLRLHGRLDLDRGRHARHAGHT